MPPVSPSAAPSIRNNGSVPSHWSNQYPSSAGNTISTETVVMRELHAIANAIAERSSGGFTSGTMLYPRIKVDGNFPSYPPS